MRSPLLRASFTTTTNSNYYNNTNNNNSHDSKNNKFIAKIISNGNLLRNNDQLITMNPNFNPTNPSNSSTATATGSSSFNRSASYTPYTHNEYKIFKTKSSQLTLANNNESHLNHQLANVTNSDKNENEFYQIPVIDYSNKDYVITRL